MKLAEACAFFSHHPKMLNPPPLAPLALPPRRAPQTSAAPTRTACGACAAWRGCSRPTSKSWRWRGATGEGVAGLGLAWLGLLGCCLCWFACCLCLSGSAGRGGTPTCICLRHPHAEALPAGLISTRVWSPPRRRLLWQAYCARPWSAATHHTFPPTFKAAVKTLLLAARFGEERQRPRLCQPQPAAEEEDVQEEEEDEEQEEEDGCEACCAATERAGAPAAPCAGAVAAAGLAMLPPELLAKVISYAAYPLSAWVNEATLAQCMALEAAR